MLHRRHPPPMSVTVGQRVRRRRRDLTVNANTQFFFRQPQNHYHSRLHAASAPVPRFSASHDLVRGFKVHASVVDPLATPLVAQSIDIETAVYDGQISAANTTGFTMTRLFSFQLQGRLRVAARLRPSLPTRQPTERTTAPAAPNHGIQVVEHLYLPPALLTSGTNCRCRDFLSATASGSVPSTVRWVCRSALTRHPASAHTWRNDRGQPQRLGPLRPAY